MKKQNLKYLFSRAFTPYSALIRAYPPNGPFSHCGILNEKEKVVEAIAFQFYQGKIRSGVVETDLDRFIKKNTRVVLLEINPVDKEQADNWLEESIGSGYDWSYVVSTPFRVRGGDSTGRYACSEHCAVYASKAKLDIFAPGIHNLTPNHLFQLLYAAGGRITKEFK